MKEYLLGIIAAAFAISLINCLCGRGAGLGTRRLVSGILLTLAVFRPLGNLELTFPEPEEFRFDAEEAVSAGMEQADSMRLQRITERYCAYILTKAAALGLEAEVQVTVGEDAYPDAVTVTAAASPVERQELTGILVRELGIEKEAVVWIDPYQSSESMPSCEHTNIPS